MMPVSRSIPPPFLPGLLCILSHFFAAVSLTAQEPPKPTLFLGPFAEAGTGITLADQPLPVYSLSPGCGTFGEIGSASRVEFGGYVAMPAFFSRNVGLAARIGFFRGSEGFRGEPIDPQRLFDSASSTLVTIDREFRLEGITEGLSLEILLRYEPAERWTVEAGPAFGYRLSTSFEQTDNVLGPGDIRFDDGQGSRTMEEGMSLSGRSFNVGAGLGISYSHKLSRPLRLVPSIRLKTDLLSAANEASWITLRGTAGVGLLFDLTPSPPPPDTPPEAPEPPPPPAVPPPTAAIRIIGVDADGNETRVSRIRGVEVLHERRLPLLDRLFYEEGEITLPDRYDVGSGTEEAEHSDWSIIDAHHHYPGIIIERMKEHAGTKISLSGSGAGNEPAGIAAERIESFRTSLAARGVESERIALLPFASNRSDERKREGMQENRRIEISSTDPALTSPLVLESIERDFSPPSIRVVPDFDSPVGIADWKMTVTQNGNPMADYSRADLEKGESPDFQWEIRQRRGDTSIAPLVARIEVTDSLGRTALAFDTIPLILEKRRDRVDDDVEIAVDMVRKSSWLIGFGYDSDALTPEMIAELKRMMEFLRPGGRISVTGFTDRTGTEEHNLSLSRKRADRVAGWISGYLSEQKMEVEEMTVTGAGVDEEHFDNDLPEGRVLSRSVLIRIDRAAEESDLP